jgi:hypothetical protein
MILTKLAVASMRWVGFESHSELYTRISVLIFVAVFFNTAILYPIANADFKDSIPILSGIFHGPYDDYSVQWYGDVGNTMVISMVINALCPVLEFWVECILYWFDKRMD